MKFLIMLLLAISFCAEISAQKELTSSKNQLGINAVYLKSYFKDGHLSPLHYKGNGLGIQLDYLRQKTVEGNIFSFTLGGNYGNATTGGSEFLDASPIIANLNVAYLFRANKSNQSVQFHLGPAYNFDILVFLSTKFPVPALSFLGAHDLDIQGQVKIKLKEKSWLQARLSFPVLSSVIRPPYNVIDEYFLERKTLKILTDGDITTWNKYQAFDWEVDFISSLSNRIDFRASYRFQYKRMVEVQTLVYGAHQLGAGFYLKF